MNPNERSPLRQVQPTQRRVYNPQPNNVPYSPSIERAIYGGLFFGFLPIALTLTFAAVEMNRMWTFTLKNRV